MLETLKLKRLRILTISVVVTLLWIWELFEHFINPSTSEATFFIELGFITFILVILLYFLFGALIKVFERFKKSHQDLLNLQNYQSSILESSPYAILAINPDRSITIFNKQAELISGYKSEEILGKDILNLFKEKSKIQEFLNSAYFQNNVLNLKETVLITKHEDEIPVALLFQKIESEGDNSSGFVIIFEDLRERKKLEKRLILSEKMAAVSQLAAGLAHEIRNPLTSISINLYNLRECFKDDNARFKEKQKYFYMILSEIERLNQLIDNFVKSIVPSQPKGNVINCNILEIIEAALNRHKDNFENKKINLVKKFPKNSLSIKCDIKLITQAFSNIIQNSLESMSTRGELIIEIKKMGNECLTKICDTGCGIPPENMDKIFDFYFTTKPTGLGIGLPFTYMAIEQHGGKIEVESEIGKGTCVYVWLPLLKENLNYGR